MRKARIIFAISVFFILTSFYVYAGSVGAMSGSDTDSEAWRQKTDRETMARYYAAKAGVEEDSEVFTYFDGGVDYEGFPVVFVLNIDQSGTDSNGELKLKAWPVRVGESVIPARSAEGSAAEEVPAFATDFELETEQETSAEPELETESLIEDAIVTVPESEPEATPEVGSETTSQAGNIISVADNIPEYSLQSMKVSKDTKAGSGWSLVSFGKLERHDATVAEKDVAEEEEAGDKATQTPLMQGDTEKETASDIPEAVSESESAVEDGTKTDSEPVSETASEPATQETAIPETAAPETATALATVPKPENEAVAQPGWKARRISFAFMGDYSTTVAEVQPDYPGRSKWGVGGKIAAKYRLKSGITLGIDLAMNVYSFENWGYKHRYYVATAIAKVGYEIRIVDWCYVFFDIGNGVDFRIYGKQTGFFPVSSGCIGFGFDISNVVGIVVDVGMSFTPQRLFSKGIYAEDDFSYFTPEIGLKVSL